MVATQADYQDYFRPLSFARVYANDAGAPMPDSEKTLSAIELHRMKDSADQLLSSREEGGRLQELDLIVTDAAYKVLTCWNSGGRFWYLETDVTSSTACVPSTCTEEHIERNVARMFFEKIAPPGFTPEINLVRELFHWGQMQLDFVIIGMDGCGSTSLHRILAQHTEVTFTNISVFNVDEDFFLIEMGRQTLPFRAQVERLNLFRMELQELKGDSQLVGLYQPYMWHVDVLRMAIKQMPNLRVLATVCDPVDRFERRMHGQSRPSDEKLSESVARQLNDDASVNLAQKWRGWHAAFGHRILFVEQLRLCSDATWRTISKFLKIRPFPRTFRFPRYNARGSRTNLCQHPELLDDLKAR